MIDENAPLHNTDEPDDDPADDPDYVPNPPYDLPVGAASWNEWCQ